MDHIEIDFPVQPFRSVLRLLQGTVLIFAFNLHFIAGVTLLVYLPATLILQFLFSQLNVPTNGVLSYFLMSADDLVLSALVVPAILFGLTYNLRDGKLPPLADSLRWGMRQWARMLWNTFKMEVSILLASLLLIVPGIIVAIDLIFTETIVAIEGDRTIDVRERTRSLARGHRWRIFFTMLPLTVLGMVGNMAVLKALGGAANSHVLLALADSLLTVVAQLGTVAVLLIYLGLIEPTVSVAVPQKPTEKVRRAR